MNTAKNKSPNIILEVKPFIRIMKLFGLSPLKETTPKYGYLTLNYKSVDFVYYCIVLGIFFIMAIASYRNTVELLNYIIWISWLCGFIFHGLQLRDFFKMSVIFITMKKVDGLSEKLSLSQENCCYGVKCMLKRTTIFGIILLLGMSINFILKIKQSFNVFGALVLLVQDLIIPFPIQMNVIIIIVIIRGMNIRLKLLRRCVNGFINDLNEGWLENRSKAKLIEALKR